MKGRYRNFVRAAKKVAPGINDELLKHTVGIQAVAGLFNAMFRQVAERQRFKYISSYVRNNRSLDSETLTEIACVAVVDPLLEVLFQDDQGHFLTLQSLLEGYIELSVVAPEIEGEGRPVGKGDAFGARWSKVEKAFLRLSPLERVNLFSQLIECYKQKKGADDFWILRDLAPLLEVREAKALVDLAVGEGGTDSSGRHTNLSLFLAISQVANDAI